jgi:asparagine synthase (glutamine-hydrolysing)
MVSASGRYVVAFNGEIYNFRALRLELSSSTSFRGDSDTEVLLAAIESWGLLDALQRLNGMFALALWDRSERCLYLARDRFGEKPLYYGQGTSGVLLFGSELKALRAHPDFEGGLDRNSLATLLRLRYIPAPNTIFKAIRKLPAASFLKISEARDASASPVSYWSMHEVAERGRASPFLGNLTDATEQLDALLRRVVGLRMLADVPLGAFLSGGIDSSIIVAMMQSESAKSVRTFTIGFNDPKYNEAEYAKAVAQHLGTEHTEHYVSAQEALDVIPKLATLYDEPFADSSQIPTFLVSRLARQHVTVALSGDAGDELFCGYQRYPDARQAWRKVSRFPSVARVMASSAMGHAPDGPVDSVLRAVSRGRLSSVRLRAVAEIVGARDGDDLYARLVSTWQDPSSVVLGTTTERNPILEQLRLTHGMSAIERMMLTDTLTYLPDDILTKVDRASMGVGLEARVPLLDPDVVAFAWSLPEHMKLHGREGKIVLRRVLQRYVPARLIERPKMGFGIPLDDWLRGPLREWADAHLDEGRLRRGGHFRVAQVRKRWLEHRSGARDWHRLLWPVLIFQAWNAP